MPYMMAKDVRIAVGETAARCENRSLLFSKYPDFPKDSQDKEAKKRSIAAMIRLRPDAIGCRARADFLASLKQSGYPCTVLSCRLQARLIINQAGGVLENAGLCLDPYFGTPYIPGTALKGISRMAAEQDGPNRNEILAVFGWSAGDRALPDKVRDMSFAGSVSFLPAYPVHDAPVGIDILTCHHPDYYRDSNKTQALDTESPIPNPFPVIEAGAEFAFPLVMLVRARQLSEMKTLLDLTPLFDPLCKARAWLLQGLTQHGAGAKTAAGYGWFSHDADAETKRAAAELAQTETAENERRQQQDEERLRLEEEKRLASMDPVDRIREQLLKMGDEEFAAFAKELSQKTTEEQKAFVMILRSEKRERWKTWRKKKPELAQAIQTVANTIGEALL